ncbi:MAG: hypothetical protein AAF203_01700 [Pseudomonadota bacterium]
MSIVIVIKSLFLVFLGINSFAEESPSLLDHRVSAKAFGCLQIAENSAQQAARAKANAVCKVESGKIADSFLEMRVVEAVPCWAMHGTNDHVIVDLHFSCEYDDSNPFGL